MIRSADRTGIPSSNSSVDVGKASGADERLSQTDVAANGAGEVFQCRTCGQNVVGTGVAPVTHIGLLVRLAQHDQRNDPRWAGQVADGLDGSLAGGVGQLGINKGDVIGHAAQGLHRCRTGGDRVDHVAFPAQHRHCRGA